MMWEGNTQGWEYDKEAGIIGAILKAAYNVHIITSMTVMSVNQLSLVLNDIKVKINVYYFITKKHMLIVKQSFWVI